MDEFNTADRDILNKFLTNSYLNLQAGLEIAEILEAFMNIDVLAEMSPGNGDNLRANLKKYKIQTQMLVGINLKLRECLHGSKTNENGN